MNFPTILVLMILAVWFFFAVRYLWRMRKHGGCASCGGGCSGQCSACAAHGTCGQNMKQSDKLQ